MLFFILISLSSVSFAALTACYAEKRARNCNRKKKKKKNNKKQTP
jgi:hypothetical protein